MALTEVKHPKGAAISLFERIAGQPLANTERLAEAIHVRPVKSGETIFGQDEPHPYIYVIETGLVKLTYLRADGEEWIKSFATEGRFFASLSALLPMGRATFSAVAIEACRLERIPFATLQALVDTDLGWSRMLRNALMILAERKERRERQFLTLDPEERYRSLIAEEPDLVLRAPQKDLAGYLGITPVGLSRIAKRVRAEAHTRLNPG
ncbi:Nitrogen fixation regulation protein FixK [Ensifer sp. M14]|uniref:Crp/Fnr family transcriptional regulator n=1 Tax=Ensifer sp. M14 TaxID=2203782 RepID=UPI000E1CCCA5|nr:Crp/Fnr family transcriptional regulator [Ensifer sp. M14]RDL48752.1 Nitrogen fixation regulation protein FixK [Ensifer sp. M14]